MAKEFSLNLSKTYLGQNRNLNDELLWFARSLGLIGTRDKDQSCFRVFIELLKSSISNNGLSSDELASRLNLTRGTVIHHLARLEISGIVSKKENAYSLTSDSLESLIDHLSYNVVLLLKDLKSVAVNVDKKLGLK